MRINKFLYLIIILSILQIKASQVLQSVFEDFNNKISEISNQWSRKDTTTKPNIFRCTKGMDLVILQQALQQCSEVSVSINTLLPHFKIQYYIDLYGYSTIDCQNNENILIDIDDQKQFDQCFPLGSAQQGTFHNAIQISGINYTRLTSWKQTIMSLLLRQKYKVRQTKILKMNHILFRNVQLLVFRCDKLCKTCNEWNTCTSCYHGQLPNCESSNNDQNAPFLDILSDNCVAQCSHNLGYDNDQVCDESGNIQNKCEVIAQSVQIHRAAFNVKMGNISIKVNV